MRSAALDRDLVAAEQQRCLVRVGRAADVLEQRGVVDVLGIAARGIGGSGELERDERRAPRLARLESHADVGHH